MVACGRTYASFDRSVESEYTPVGSMYPFRCGTQEKRNALLKLLVLCVHGILSSSTKFQCQMCHRVDLHSANE